MLKAVKSDHPPPRERLSAGEWKILRACCHVGAAAATNDILREVLRYEITDYRYVQVHLERLADKGYLTVEREGPRREVWTPVASAELMVAEAMKQVIREVIGSDRQMIWIMRKVLQEVEDEIVDSE